MNETMPTDIDGFRKFLNRRRADYIHIESPLADRAHIRFIGAFAGKPVIWDATVMTLAYCKKAGMAGNSRFIEIGDHADDMCPITIGLDLDEIDEPDLLKTIIMIRKYRRLRRGRHEFGKP